LEQANVCHAHEFIICTEDGVAQRLIQDFPQKSFYTPSRQQALCPNMKMTRLENVAKALRGEVEEIQIPADVFEKARLTLDRMLAVPITEAEAGQGSAACRCKTTPILVSV